MEKKILCAICLSSALLASACADPAPEDGECQNGIYMCASNTLNMCVGEKWQVVMSCANDQTCNSNVGQCVPNSITPTPGETCTTGKFRCDANVLKKCDANSWNVVDICETNSACDDSVGQCKQSGGQNTTCSGNPYCESNSVVYCSGGQKVIDNCGDKQCVVEGTTASCVQKVCDNGDIKGKEGESKKQVCESNAWKDVDCAEGSFYSESKKDCVRRICVEGAKQCNSNNVETCKGNAWVKTAECGSSAKCDNEKFSCEAIDSCVIGSRMCSGNSIVQCDDGHTYNVQIDSCQGKVCDTKTDGSVACINKVCVDGQHKCDGDTLQYCDNNDWKTDQTCKTGLCSESKGMCLTCGEGDVKCDGAKLMVCNNNVWVQKQTCASDSMCNARAQKCDDCSGDDKVCDGSVLKTCKNGQWDRTDCGATGCDSASKECKAAQGESCKANTYSCDGATLKFCNGSGWQIKGSCLSAAKCDDKAGKCIECEDGYVDCQGTGSIVTCDGGSKKTTTCKENEICSLSAKKCVAKECVTPNKYECNGSKLVFCTSEYKKQEMMDCGLATLCGATEDGSLGCKPPTSWCSFHALDTNRHVDQGYGRINMETLDVSDIKKAAMACGQLDKPVMSWRAVEGLENTECGADCGVNKEFGTYSFDGAAGDYACTFRFDIGTDSYACLPGKGIPGHESSDGGQPIKLDNTTKLTKDKTVALTVAAYNEANRPTWCNLQKVSNLENRVYSRIYLGDNEGTSPALVDPKARCTNASGDLPAIDKWEKSFDGYQNLLFIEDESSKGQLEFRADVDLDGDYVCAFTYTFGGKTYACSTSDENGMADASGDTKDTWYWGESFTKATK